jgi:hypothetical protein
LGSSHNALKLSNDGCGANASQTADAITWTRRCSIRWALRVSPRMRS